LTCWARCAACCPARTGSATYKRPEQKKWYAGETISLGIGQGYNAFTMLQLAQATAILANNGIKHKPQLVIATQDSVSRARIPVPADPPVDLGYKPENVAVVRKALVGVTQEGTSARVFAGAGYLSGGKTGTAQAVTIGQKDKYNAGQAGRAPARPCAVHGVCTRRRPEDRDGRDCGKRRLWRRACRADCAARV
jgi:cell division protein FtsI/penicillin-binding protein 2